MNMETNPNSDRSTKPAGVARSTRGGRGGSPSQSKGKAPIITVVKAKRPTKPKKDGIQGAVSASGSTSTPNVVPTTTQTLPLTDKNDLHTTASQKSFSPPPSPSAEEQQEQVEKLRQIEAQKQALDARLDENRLTADKRAGEIHLESERQKRLQKQSDNTLSLEKTTTLLKTDDVEATTSEAMGLKITPSPVSAFETANTTSTAKKAVEDDRNKRDDKRQAGSAEEERHFSPKVVKGVPPRRQSKLTVAQALREEADLEERTRSLAMIKRKREKERLKSRQALTQTEKIKREVIVPETITVGMLASRMTERTSDVIKALFHMGVVATSTHEIDADTAELVVVEFGHECKRVADADVESILDEAPETLSEAPLSPRPPIVTVMGHVDHGKTSLLDALRKTNVQAGEAGGITQGIRAYQVKVDKEDRQVTFIDTPGHEAFTAMRARGANVTDIVVLIIAADSGIMPQTIEAINHAKAADVPIVVAINKIDLPNANVEKTQNQLLEHDVIPEHLGGDVQCVPISVKSGEGIQDLLASLLLQADLLECKSPFSGYAKGVVLEARVDKGKGCVTTVLVTSGSLAKGDVFLVGSTWGKVKNIRNDRGQNVAQALPSQPVEILGAMLPPLAGDFLQVMPKNREAKAQEIATYRLNTEKDKRLSKAGHVENIDALFDKFKETSEQTLTIVVKADVQGMVEAIRVNLENIAFDAYKVRIVHAGVGAVNASDIALAATSKGLVIAFNVKLPPDCERKARQENVRVIHHNIIHHLIEEVEQLLRNRLEPVTEEILLGTAEVREVFDIGKHGIIAGCAVVSGKILKSGRFIVLRNHEDVVFEGSLKSLRRFRNEVNSVDSGYECGMSFENFDTFAVGDVIQCHGPKT